MADDATSIPPHAGVPVRPEDPRAVIDRASIVIVEDEPGIVELVTDLLSSLGARVASARDGSSGLDLLNEQRPDLLILDKNLPGLSGVEMLRRARALGVDCEVILVTAYGNLESSIECMELNCFAYMLKPFHLTTLQTHVGKAIERRRMSAALRERTRQLEAALDDLKAAEGRLAHSESMAAMGRLATNVAHEIRNPATYVVGYADCLGSVGDTLDALIARYQCGVPWRDVERSALGTALRRDRELLDEAPRLIRDGIGRIVDLAQDLTSFSRIEHSREAVYFDLRQVVDATLRMTVKDVTARARLVVDVETLPPLYGQPGRISQILLNLVSNAMDALPVGQPAAHEIRVTARRQGACVCLSVSDTGTGIAPEALPRIFEPFYTTKAVGKGTGVGLSICRELTRRMGGTIEATNGPERGAVLTVMLPLRQPDDADAAARGEEAEASAVAAVGEARGRVLVVDDEPGLLEVFRRMLGGRHEVIVARDGQEALDLLRSDGDFNLVVCDVVMPRVNGVQFLERVRAEAPHLNGRFVFMTGDENKRRLAELLGADETALLPKPLDFEAIHGLICRGLERPVAVP